MNNFYNDPPIVRELQKFVGAYGAVPPQINDDYVRVLARCRIGRTSGVSSMALPLYDALFDLFGEPQIRAFVGVLERPEIKVRLDNHGCADRFREIATKLMGKVVDQPLRRVYELVLRAGDPQLPKLSPTTEFQSVVKASQPR